MLHDVVPMVEIRREIERLWAMKSLGEVGRHGVFCDRKRYGSRQEAVTGELRSRGTIYRKVLVSKTGMRLSWPISVADRGQKSRRFLLYRTVARNGGGIPHSVVYPLIFVKKILRRNILNRADDRKRYNATIPRHREVQQNTPRFFTLIRVRYSRIHLDFGCDPRRVLVNSAF